MNPPRSTAKSWTIAMASRQATRVSTRDGVGVGVAVGVGVVDGSGVGEGTGVGAMVAVGAGVGGVLYTPRSLQTDKWEGIGLPSRSTPPHCHSPAAAPAVGS